MSQVPVDRPGLMLFPAGGTARGARWRRRDAGCAVGGWPRGAQVTSPRCLAASFRVGGQDGRAGC